ncbi:MAG: M20/M25/M40 family metallo-hydrolase [Chitinophagaceae bacterium]
MKKMVAFFSAYLIIIASSAFAQEKLDADVVNKIKQESLQNSKVMDIAFHLTDVSGPRLTNSPGYNRAANWAVSEMKKWGLVNAALEPWGEFGKGWELQKSYIAMTAPYYKPIIGFPKTWTKSTSGLQNADVILITAKDSTELEQYRGKLAGKIILLYRSDTLRQSFRPDATRRTDEDLDKIAKAQPQQQQTTDTAQQRRMREQFQRMQGPAQMTNKIKDHANKEGAVAILSMNPRGKDGTLFVQGGGAYTATAPENFLDIVVAIEDYMSMVRLLKAGIPVKLELDVKSAFQTADTKGYNVVAEIKGTDPKLKDELVMLGGHLDSWQGSTGATDNAAGCAVMMEAMRILKTLGVKPRRTIRIALWGGEEQGLHGSNNYVKNHFADRANMQLKSDHAKVAGYFNLDNGTGKIRGIYLQGNASVGPVFSKWLEPFHDIGAKTVTISNTGGTDHLAFDAVGIPGFQFIQDEIEYDTRTHHTNMDSYDHLIADDLKQAATIVAAFVYHTAMRDEKLPRKELPKPRVEGQRSF